MLNHVSSTENPFAEAPDGSSIKQTLYNPVTFDVHYGAIPQVYDSALVTLTRVGGANNSTINISLECFYLNIMVEYTNVIYSLSGHYVVNITSTAGGHPDVTFEFLIDIEGKHELLLYTVYILSELAYEYIEALISYLSIELLLCRSHCGDINKCC